MELEIIPLSQNILDVFEQSSYPWVIHHILKQFGGADINGKIKAKQIVQSVK